MIKLQKKPNYSPFLTYYD